MTVGSPRPGVLHRAWQRWKRVAHAIGEVQARILLTMVYFTLVAPFGLAVRWLTDPLALKPTTPKGWRPRPPSERTARERARLMS